MGNIMTESSVKQELNIDDDSDLSSYYDIDQDYPSSYSDFSSSTSDETVFESDYSYSTSSEEICSTDVPIGTIIGRGMMSMNSTSNEENVEDNSFQVELGWPFMQTEVPPDCDSDVLKFEYKNGNERCVCSQWDQVNPLYREPRHLVHQLDQFSK